VKVGVLERDASRAAVKAAEEEGMTSTAEVQNFLLTSLLFFLFFHLFFLLWHDFGARYLAMTRAAQPDT
jgi:hypothetical protein